MFRLGKEGQQWEQGGQMMWQLVGTCAKEGCRGGRVQVWQGRGTGKLGLACRTRWPGFPAVERQRKLRLEFSDTPLG